MNNLRSSGSFRKVSQLGGLFLLSVQQAYYGRLSFSLAFLLFDLGSDKDAGNGSFSFFPSCSGVLRGGLFVRRGG